MRDGDEAAFLAHDEREGVGLLADAHGRAVAHAGGGEAELVVRDGEEAVGGGEAAAPDDDAAIVERERRGEDGDHEFGRNLRVEGDAGRLIALQRNGPLDGDEGAEPPLREEEEDVGELLGQADLAGRGPPALLVLGQHGADGFEDAADLGLEEDDGGEREVDEEAAQDLLQDVELEEEGEGGERGDEDARAHEDLPEARAARGLQDGVDDEVEDGDLDGVRHVGPDGREDLAPVDVREECLDRGERHVGFPPVTVCRPVSAARASMSASTCFCVVTSRAVVGSSAMSSFGSHDSAMAMMTR